jgi:glutamine---fructose-6-phosphate transaminase (isomerizing)
MFHATLLSREIYEQQAVIARQLTSSASAVSDAATRIRTFKPDVVLLAARGSSDNVARYAQYLLGAVNRQVVALSTPSLFTLYHQPPRLNRALTIGISQSGQSPDVVAVIEETRQQGGLTLAITNTPSSPLAKTASVVIPLGVGDEHSVAATKTYTASLLAVAMLSTAIDGSPERAAALNDLPQAMKTVLTQHEALADVARAFAGHSRFLVLGRGYNYSTAFEIALKMKETSYVLAEAHSMADLMHGPLAIVNGHLPTILVAPSGVGSGDAPSMLLRLKKQDGKVIVFSDRKDDFTIADVVIPLPCMPEWLSPLIAIVAGQLWALEFAIARGCDPDHPFGLTKVTKTT